MTWRAPRRFSDSVTKDEEGKNMGIKVELPQGKTLQDLDEQDLDALIEEAVLHSQRKVEAPSADAAADGRDQVGKGDKARKLQKSKDDELRRQRREKRRLRKLRKAEMRKRKEERTGSKYEFVVEDDGGNARGPESRAPDMARDRPSFLQAYLEKKWEAEHAEREEREERRRKNRQRRKELEAQLQGKPLVPKNERVLGSIDPVTGKITPLEKGRWIWARQGGVPPELASGELRHEVDEIFKAGFEYLGMGRRAQHLDTFNMNTPEIAFVGRSNVGKSSLINSLLFEKGRSSQKGARVSKKPGRTTTAHLFAVGYNETWAHRRSLPTFRVVFADLPGYGHAAVSADLSSSMSTVVAHYLHLRERDVLAAVVVLVDAKVGIENDNDLQMCNFLEELGLPYRIVLTKCDRVHESELDNRVRECISFISHPEIRCAHPVIIGVSSKLFRARTSRKRLVRTRYSKSQDGNVARLRHELVSQADAYLMLQKRSTKRVRTDR